MNQFFRTWSARGLLPIILLTTLGREWVRESTVSYVAKHPSFSEEALALHPVWNRLVESPQTRRPRQEAAVVARSDGGLAGLPGTLAQFITSLERLFSPITRFLYDTAS